MIIDIIRHAKPPFLCDYVRNSYYKHVITSTAEITRVFKSQTAHSK